MNRKHIFYTAIFAAGFSLTACNNEDKKPEVQTENVTKEPKIKEENISYTGDGISMNGFVAYDENKEGVRPAVIVIPEWWGLNDYPKHRAKQLAELGYIAIAIDMYGNGKTADNPDSAGKYATPFYQDPQMAKRRFDAALQKLKSYSQTDTGRIAAIGYCFGGAQVLNMARLGENLKGVVSFHGNLMGVPADKNTLKAAILICHGAADSFVPAKEVELFKKEMEKVGGNYTFKAYDSATHAFTNPDATEAGKKFKLPIAYNAAADSASWQDMKAFFGKIFQ
ncbi:dienelactone hydrolase family protein [Terrimonas sp. NA20]|uniref:Dienelactone hydrolase family protein n=1 Tax=Terrimonas ginsenosidimutans TaxID=2908004 RepID=A0ABS9KYR7_9BACT|nr:dienelactone hydrolase family protein [Terrimonas ginsenosidimutans]MCG2617372.1 dienelactone hydrolase family protein [Terrimonas ginsenosidimutans]